MGNDPNEPGRNSQDSRQGEGAFMEADRSDASLRVTAPRRGRAEMVAGVVALCLALGLTWPLVIAPGELLAGHPGNDNWNHVWGYWWVAESLSNGSWPLRTELLAFPDGGSLYFIDVVQVIATLPIQLLLGPVVAYNVVVVAGFWLSAFAAWLLTRKLVGDPWCAGVAMVIYGASPHLLGQAYNGISETLCAGWFPLTLWCLIRVVERPVRSRALVLGVVFALCVLTSWYYGLFAIIGGVVVLSWLAVRQPWLLRWRSVIRRLVEGGVLATVLVGPMLVAFRQSLEASDALVSRDPEFVRASLLRHNITDLLAFFRPGKTPSPDLQALFGEELVIVIYVGWVGLVLAGAALWLTRRRQIRPWVWLGLVFFVFSLGPYLYFGGEYLELRGRRVPLPFLPLFEALPLFGRVSHPFRFVSGMSLAMAVLAAHGLRHVLRNRDILTRAVVASTVAVLGLAEFALGSPATIPVPTSEARIPGAYSKMREDPEPGAVLDIPLTVPNLERAVYVWYQAEHGRAVPWGLNDPMPRGLLLNRLAATLIRIEAVRSWQPAPRLPELDLVVGARNLERLGYRYVVLHENLYPHFKREQVESILTGLFGSPERWEDDGLLVYTL